MSQKTPPDHFKHNYNATLHYYAMMIKAAKAKSQATADDLYRRLGSTDLFFLLVFVLKRKDINRKWLFERCREVQLDPNEHLDLWAREHYKSTILTFGLTIFDIINDPEITIGIFSHTKSIARDFLRQIKFELESNPDLPRLWPNIFYEEPARQSPRWSVEGGIVVKRNQNPKEATIEGNGLVDGMPTGKHYMLRIYDDVVTPESVNTPEQIAKTTEARQMSDNLGAEGGTQRFIGTRYHLFDDYSVLMADEIVTPRIRPATDDGTEFGNPVLLSVETLARKRKTQGTYVFNSQQLLNPTADKSMGFALEWLVKADTDYDAAMNSLWRFIIVDPASRKPHSKTTNKNDYTSMFVLGYGADEKFRVLEMRRDRLSLSQRAAALFELHQKWKPSLVAYEEYGMQADIEHIKHVQKEKLYEFEITPLGGKMKKELRILRLVPYFENGYKSVQDGGDGIAKSRIVFPTSCLQKDHEGKMHDLVTSFVQEEYIAFPVLKHDDMMDCLARIVDLEKMALIQKPSVTPARLQSTRVEEGLRRLGHGRNESWITA